MLTSLTFTSHIRQESTTFNILIDIIEDSSRCTILHIVYAFSDLLSHG